MAGRTQYELALQIGGKVQSSLGKSVGEVNNRLTSIGKAASTMAKVAAGAFAVIKVKDFVSDCTNATMNFESSMADVAKVVDGLKDNNGNLTESYYDMSKSIMEMSKNIPMTAEEITQLIAAAGQSGIAADELIRFAEDAAKMGVAFDLPAEKAGEMAAVIRSSLGITQDEFVVLADKINYFGNTTTQSADSLIEVVQTTGLIGKQAGVNADQIAAMGAAMNGMDVSNMGTALSNIYGSLMTGSGATKAAQDAWKSLGFTSEQIAKDMLVDAEGTMIKVFEAMKAIPKDELSATTAAIFGNNKSTKMAIASFTENLDGLKQNFKDIGDVAVYAGSMEAEYASVSATSANSVKLLKNTFEVLKIQIGNLFLPVLGKALSMLSSGVGLIENFVGSSEGGFGKALSTLSPFMDTVNNIFLNLAEGKGIFESFNSAMIDNLGISIPDAFKRSIQRIIDNVLFLKDQGIIAFSNIKQKIEENKPTIDKVILVADDLKEKLFQAFEKAKPTITYLATVAIPGLVGSALKIVGAVAIVYNKLNEWGLLIPIVKGVAIAIAAIKMVQFAKNTINAVKAVKALVTVLLAQQKAHVALSLAKAKDKLQTLYIHALYAKDAIVRGASTAATWAQTAATTAWTTVSGIAATATIALGAAFRFMTGPIGIAITIIGAIIAAGIYLYKNWDTVKVKAAQLAQWISGKFELLKEKVSSAISAFAEKFPAAFAFISSIAESWWQTMNGVFAGVKQIFDGVIQFVKGVFSGDWEQAFSGLKQIASGAFTALRSIVMAPLNALKGYYTSGYTFLNNLTGGKLDEMKNKFTEKLSSVKQTVSDSFTNVMSNVSGFMQQAKDTAGMRLQEMQSAYTSAGGGIRGVVAASMTGVQSTISSVMSVANTLTGGKLDEIRNNFSSKLSAAKAFVFIHFNSIKTTISNIIEGAKTIVSNGLDTIKGFFSGCKLTLPKIKLPHFSITGSFSVAPPQVPKVGVSWYKNGGILTKPTIFGASGGNLLGGGEAGKEAVLPLSTLWGKMESIISNIVKNQAPSSDIYVEGVLPQAAVDFIGNAVQLVKNKATEQPHTENTSVAKQLYNSISNDSTVNHNRTVNKNSEAVQFVYSPKVTIQGNADRDEIAEGLSMSQEQFNRMMDEYFRQRDRSRFA